jgi:K+-sensing histidine kinase KdpD
MSKKTPIRQRFLEYALVCITVALCVLLYRIGAYRMVVLNLFYLPVVLAAFFLGRYQAGVLAVLAVILAAIVTALDLNNFAAYTSPLVIGLVLTTWAAVLSLTAILAGTLSDERSEKIEELHEAYVGVVEVLSRYLNNADRRLNERSTLCARLAQQVAARMKLPSKEIDDIRVATLLHDMENIEVTSKVIRKAIGNVSQGQSGQHTFHGSELAQSLGAVLRGALPLLAARPPIYDPGREDDTVCGCAELPIGSHVIRTVRSYVNLVTEHPDPPSPREAVMILRNDLDDEHHPAVLHALEQMVLAENDEPVTPVLQEVGWTNAVRVE